MTTEKYGDYVRVQFLDATYPVGEDIVVERKVGDEWVRVLGLCRPSWAPKRPE